MPGEPSKADITKSQHLFLFMGGEGKKMQPNSDNTVKLCWCWYYKQQEQQQLPLSKF